jgi:UPF0716 protein FxsA
MRILAALVLLALPFTEIAVFTGIAGVVGLWPALTALLATTLAGVVLLRWQGPGTLRRLNQALETGEAAGEALIDALGLLIASILLLAPGFVTDLMALPFAVPALRRHIGRFVMAGLRGKSVFRVFVATGAAPAVKRGDVIDAEYRDVTPAPSAAPTSEPPRPPESRPADASQGTSQRKP